jgi:hypothetical protein
LNSSLPSVGIPFVSPAQPERRSANRSDHLARIVLCSFLFTFLASRILVLLIMTRRIPDFYLHLGGNHVHHLNYGIFLLSIVSGLLLFLRPHSRSLDLLAGLYGIGLALTFDEFGMWLHLGGSYWQRASWDAVALIAASLALLAFAPALGRFTSAHRWIALFLFAGLIAFSALLWKSFRYAERIAMPRLLQIEYTAPP